MRMGFVCSDATQRDCISDIGFMRLPVLHHYCPPMLRWTMSMVSSELTANNGYVSYERVRIATLAVAKSQLA